MQRSRVRFDVASMLYYREAVHRRLLAEGAFVARHLTFDASPKHGVEVYCIKERRLVLPGPSFSEWEHLPSSALGHGHAGAVDKSIGDIHCSFSVGRAKS